MIWIGTQKLTECGINNLVDRFRVTYLIVRSGDDAFAFHDLEDIMTELRQRPSEQTSPFVAYLE